MTKKFSDRNPNTTEGPSQILSGLVFQSWATAHLVTRQDIFIIKIFGYTTLHEDPCGLKGSGALS